MQISMGPAVTDLGTEEREIEGAGGRIRVSRNLLLNARDLMQGKAEAYSHNLENLRALPVT